MSKFTPVLLVTTIVLAFFVGVLWTKVSNLEKGAGGSVIDKRENQMNPSDYKLSEDQAKKVPPVSDADHLRGKKSAEVVVIEYSDFECPFCQSFHPTMQQVLQEYGDKVAWVYRHFPLVSIHARALPAANAAECVAALAGNDAFWKFTDMVFGDQEKFLTEAGLAEAAVAAGVKKTDYDSCFSSQKYNSLVTSQQKSGENAGVTATPNNFVVNKKGEVWFVPDAIPFATLKTIIDEALK